MGSLPSGIVAFLLTDVEASTQAWNRSTDATEAALTSLDLDINAMVAALEGSVVKARGEGDSHLAVFSEASRAITAAAALQRRDDTRLSLRACVLIGEARPREGDYLSAVVSHGARIRSVAHGGQTVATRPAVEVASSHLRDGLTFRTPGRPSRQGHTGSGRTAPVVRAGSASLVPPASHPRLHHVRGNGRCRRRRGAIDPSTPTTRRRSARLATLADPVTARPLRRARRAPSQARGGRLHRGVRGPPNGACVRRRGTATRELPRRSCTRSRRRSRGRDRGPHGLRGVLTHEDRRSRRRSLLHSDAVDLRWRYRTTC